MSRETVAGDSDGEDIDFPEVSVLAIDAIILCMNSEFEKKFSLSLCLKESFTGVKEKERENL